MYIALSGCLHLKLGCMTANILKDRQFQESKINGRRIRFCGQVFECHLETTCLNACLYIIRYEESRGRYLVAGRKIRRGEVVAVEAPVVAFPLTRDSQVDMREG